MAETSRSHVVYCRGCQHAWYDNSALLLAETGLVNLLDQCACTCADDTDPHYEDWAVSLDPADIPEGAWSA